ncbi:hypothetical protein, partial [Bradyrhizobium sp. SZCCHNS1054]|uniref:hypothetical protein n=1 Tax=Bradyrhizobium sp. SZCCHNS1054 TaxID=3057301 RepID=UPI003966B957
NLFVVLLVMAPSSQELEPPANPGRFTGEQTASTAMKGCGIVCAPILHGGLGRFGGEPLHGQRGTSGESHPVFGRQIAKV